MSQTELLAKLREVAEAIPFVEKGGHNKHHDYDFVQAVDVTKIVREKLLACGVIVIPGASNARHLAYGSKGGHLTTVDLIYRVTDVADGSVIEIPWVGVGTDTGGDKGIYKAYTGGFKYALLSLFMIPTSNDPERDELTPSGGEGEGAHKDDNRPAAPRIPVDRAQEILKTALAVGMAEDNGEGAQLHAVLKAVLAEHGVAKIGMLDVDQAEAVEAFLAREVIERAQAGPER